MAKIVVDAGHGGTDNGASGILNDVTYYEKTVNLDIALKLRDFLMTVKPQVEVIMTRINDIFITVCDRGTIAQTKNADVFISCHNNAITDKTACGTLTLYPDPDIPNYMGSKTFAEFVQRGMVDYLNNQGWQMQDRGVANFRVGLGVFRCSAPIPACLTETSFMTCPSDMEKLSKEKFREDAAYGIAVGIINYLNAVKGGNFSQPLRQPKPPVEEEKPPVIIEPNIIIPAIIALGLAFGITYFILGKG